MTIYQMAIIFTNSGRLVEFQVEESVAATILSHFLSPPSPTFRQQYAVLKGNAGVGWRPMVLAIDWKLDVDAVWYYEATEQPPPQ